MPNPFSNTEGVVKATPSAVNYEPVVNSTLTCMYCFGDSSEGTYWPQAQRLVWDCDHCGETNVVRDIEL